MRVYILYILSRYLGTGVDTLVLWLCSDFIFSGNYFGRNVLSPIISFEFAVISNFLCSYFFIWNNRVEEKSVKSFLKHFVVFNIAALSGFAIKMLFLLLFEHIYGWDVIICNLVALCISGVLNFFVEKLIVFRKRKEHPEHELLNVGELADMSPIFRGRMGALWARLVIAVCDASKLNVLYDQVYFEEGPGCAAKLLHYVDCDYRIGYSDRLSQLPEGPFIIVSNQPYGALDAIILIDMIGRERSDFKLLASEMFSRIKPLSDSFVYARSGGGREYYSEVSEHMASGSPVGIFPSGVGADYYVRPRRVIDRPWDLTTVRFIQEAHLPIVPIRFLDRNSRFYYWLGHLGLPLRLLRLPSELFNKSKGEHRVVIGNTISVEEQSRYVRPSDFHDFLWSAIYDMHLPDSYVARSSMGDFVKNDH